MKRLLLFLLQLLTLSVTLGQGVQVVSVKRKSNNDVLYLATTIRNVTTYPLTTSGLNSFTAAANSGALSLTVHCPDGTRSVIAPGSARPAVSPCNSLSTSLLDARYSYSTATRVLEIEAAPANGAALTLKIEPMQGSISAMQSGGGQALSVNTDYPPGPLTGQGSFTQEWGFRPTALAGSGVPQLPLKLTWKRTSDNASFSYVFIPTNGTRKAIFTAGNSSPPGSTTGTGPSWLAARYTWVGNRLDVEGAPVNTSGIELKIARVDGQALSIQSSGGQQLAANTYYPSGPLTGQGAFVQEWSFTPLNNGGVPSVPIVLTFKKPDGTTFAHTFTPVAATRQTLFNASSGGGTTDPPTSTTNLITFTRGLALGNSFTSHEANTAIGWSLSNGMAASSLAKDYVHVMEAALKTKNNSFVLIPKGQGSSFETSYNSADPDAVSNTINNLNFELTRDYGADVKFDLILFSISENITGTFNETKFRQMLDQVLAAIPKLPNPTIVLRNSFWNGNESSNAVLQAYASEKGYKFVNLSPIRERADYKASQYSDPGVAHHPNDAGHQAIADYHLAQLTTTTTGPPSVTGGNGEFVAYADQGWSDDDQKFIENAQIKVGFKRTVGATICTIIKKSNGENIVNDYKVTVDQNDDPRFGQLISDKGRQIMFGSDYMTPGPEPNGYVINGKSTKNGYRGHVFNTGANTVQGGSLYPALDESEVQASAIVNHPTRGTMFYAKIRPAIWGVKGELGNIILEEWVWLEGNAIAYYARHTVYERTAFGQSVAEQRIYQSSEQENPCMYLIAPLTQKRARAAGQELNLNNTIGTFSDTHFTDQCWVGAYKPGGEGLTYYSPMNSAVKTAQFVGELGGENDNATAYLNAALQMNYDSPGVYEDYGYMIVGTQSEAMSKIASLPPIDQSFDFDFTKDNHRWNNLDCRARRENGDWVVHFGDAKTDNGFTSTNGNFLAPYRAWQATGISQIEFTMAVTGITKLRLKWQKPGRANTNEFSKEFDITGNGQVQTYVVSTADANWNGIISSVGLQAVTGSTQAGSAKLVVKRIRKLSLDDWSVLLLLSLGAGTTLARRRKKRVYATDRRCGQTSRNTPKNICKRKLQV